MCCIKWVETYSCNIPGDPHLGYAVIYFFVVIFFFKELNGKLIFLEICKLISIFGNSVLFKRFFFINLNFRCQNHLKLAPYFNLRYIIQVKQWFDNIMCILFFYNLFPCFNFQHQKVRHMKIEVTYLSVKNLDSLFSPVPMCKPPIHQGEQSPPQISLRVCVSRTWAVVQIA